MLEYRRYCKKVNWDRALNTEYSFRISVLGRIINIITKKKCIVVESNRWPLSHFELVVECLSKEL